MKVTIIPIVIGVLGTVTKGLVKELKDCDRRGRVETIQTTALLRLARILRRVLETWGDLLSVKLQWKTISVSRCEKLSRSNHNKQQKRENLLSCKFCRSGRPQNENEREKKRQKIWNMKVRSYRLKVIRLEWSPRAWKRAGRNWKSVWESKPFTLQYYFEEERLTVPQIPIKDHLQNVGMKTSQGVK